MFQTENSEMEGALVHGKRPAKEETVEKDLKKVKTNLIILYFRLFAIYYKHLLQYM
jgi:hypothetical protein